MNAKATRAGKYSTNSPLPTAEFEGQSRMRPVISAISIADATATSGPFAGRFAR